MPPRQTPNIRNRQLLPPTQPLPQPTPTPRPRLRPPGTQPIPQRRRIAPRPRPLLRHAHPPTQHPRHPIIPIPHRIPRPLPLCTSSPGVFPKRIHSRSGRRRQGRLQRRFIPRGGHTVPHGRAHTHSNMMLMRMRMVHGRSTCIVRHMLETLLS